MFRKMKMYSDIYDLLFWKNEINPYRTNVENRVSS